MARHLPATSATASNAKTTHTTATSPTTAIRHNAKPTSMPVCRRMRAARAAMPTSAMTAPGGPMTPRKHVQASQDAAAMNARRGGSAARASKNRQTENRGAGGEAGQAGVPPSSSNGMGVAMCCPVRERWAPPCGGETTRSRSGVTAASLLPAKKKPPECLRAASSRSHRLCRCGTIGGQRHANRLPMWSPEWSLVAAQRLGQSKVTGRKKRPPTARGKSPAAPCFALHIVSATAFTS